MAKTSKKKKAPGSKPPSKRTYERTTPVGRVRKHVEKSLRIAIFATERMSAWEHSTDPSLVAALAHARNAAASLTEALKNVDKLFDADWVPPRKATTANFTEGEEVKIADKYRAKYLSIYAPGVVDNLVVAKCLPTGEIAVRHGSQSPFITAKSHIEKKRPAKGASADSHASK
jgi:hypothetical protein